MAAHTKVGVSYNAQVAVDAKHKMIVEQAVTNQVVDIGLLMQTADPARVILDVERIDVVADRGCFRSRTSRPARRRGSRPMSPSLNADRRCAKASSPSSATIRPGTFISARLEKLWRRTTKVSCAI